MKKRILFGFILVLSLSVIFVACDKDDKDTEKPVISDFDPKSGQELLIGDSEGFIFNATFTDNDGLASYKIDIHNNFDGHDHKSSEVVASDSIPFAYVETGNLNGGKEQTISSKIVIPNSQTASGTEKYIRAGKYHFVVYCIDKSGNQTVNSHNIILIR